MTCRVRRVCAVLALLVMPAAASAQQPAPADPLARGLDLERRGNYAAAAESYRAALAARPGDPAALLGLERALVPLNRAAEILPAARAAVAAQPGAAAFGVLVRAYAGANEPDSIRRAVEQWAALAPRDEAPYREWGQAALARRDRAGAKAAFLMARQRLGRIDVLAPELAQIAIAEGDWPAATREWLHAMRQLPGYQFTALAALTPAPERVRAELLSIMNREGGPLGRRLQAALTARWGDPVAGYQVLAAALPSERVPAAEALTQFIEQVRPIGTPAALKARAMALEALADRSVGPAASRARLDAAQAYSDAGDRDGARRLLGGVAADSGAARGVASGAAAALIGVLVSDGKMDEAERRLEASRATMPADEYAALKRRVARGWIRAGQLERAERTIAADSSVDGLAVAGHIALFRGDLVGAVGRLQAAGPFAGTREEATARTAILALLQPIEADSLPALGAAMLQLERGDTAAAAAALERVAAQLPVPKGGAELRLLAGRLQRDAGRPEDAERLFRAANVADAPSTAPAAGLELGRLLIALGRPNEAVPVLEQMILTYTTSALVPQARRALDEARGAIPRT